MGLIKGVGYYPEPKPKSSNPFGSDPYKDDEKVKNWKPPWNYDPPTPPIYNYDWGDGGRYMGDAVTTKRKKRKSSKDKSPPMNEIGYPTNWNYPNWLIRMAQWRNF